MVPGAQSKTIHSLKSCYRFFYLPPLRQFGGSLTVAFRETQ